MRKKKAIVNFLFSLLVELVTVLYGFIVPRLIIGTYGSEVNGLTHSIASFIGYVSLLQSGVGSVAKAALYRPLAVKDTEKLNVAVHTIEGFFRKIATLTIIYIGVLAVAYPLLVAKEYDFLFTASLVIIIGIGTAARYFFGITYRMLLEADQNSYIYSILQILGVLVDVALVVILVNRGASIQIVKLASCSLFVLRPFILYLYVRRKYKLVRTKAIDNSLIKQRWDGFYQTIAYFIHSKTDVFVLTLFSSLENVSVYGVYAMVTTGLTTLIKSAGRAITSTFGNIIALNQKDSLQRVFNAYMVFIHFVSTIVFSTASITIFRFIQIYVHDIHDAEYIQPVFGTIILAAEYIYCLRLPYINIIQAAGKFKETKISALIEAGLNITISVILVYFFGLIGVAIGTFVAMAYRNISFIIYLKKDVVYLSVKEQAARFALSIILYVINIFVLSRIEFATGDYLSWGIYAAFITVLCTLITLLGNFIFAKQPLINAFRLLFRKRGKGKRPRNPE